MRYSSVEDSPSTQAASNLLSQVTLPRYHSNEDRCDDDFFRCDENSFNSGPHFETVWSFVSPVDLQVLVGKFQEWAYVFYITCSILTFIIIFLLQMLASNTPKGLKQSSTESALSPLLQFVILLPQFVYLLSACRWSQTDVNLKTIDVFSKLHTLIVLLAVALMFACEVCVLHVLHILVTFAFYAIEMHQKQIYKKKALIY